MRETYYSLLGLKPDATTAQVHAAYRRQARKYHPDISTSPDANQRMARINLAYETLADPDRRARYDLEIGAFTPSAAGAPGGAYYRPAQPPADAAEPSPRRGHVSQPLWRFGIASVIVASLIGIRVYAVSTWDDGVSGLGDALDGIAGIETGLDGALGGYDSTQRKIEQCYLSHPKAVHGDAEEKALLEQCLAEAKAVPAPTPASSPPGPSPGG